MASVSVKASGSVSYSRISSKSIPRFASGGYVDAGQLFIAREAGPEMVGTMGGRTAVANNGQITEGIRQAVYEGMVQAISTQSGSGGNERIVVQVGDGTLADVVISALNKKTKKVGYCALEGI